MRGVSQVELVRRASRVRQWACQVLLNPLWPVPSVAAPDRGCWGHGLDWGLPGGGQLLVWISCPLSDKNKKIGVNYLSDKIDHYSHLEEYSLVDRKYIYVVRPSPPSHARTLHLPRLKLWPGKH